MWPWGARTPASQKGLAELPEGGVTIRDMEAKDSLSTANAQGCRVRTALREGKHDLADALWISDMVPGGPAGPRSHKE